MLLRAAQAAPRVFDSGHVAPRRVGCLKPRVGSHLTLRLSQVRRFNAVMRLRCCAGAVLALLAVLPAISTAQYVYRCSRRSFASDSYVFCAATMRTAVRARLALTSPPRC